MKRLVAGFIGDRRRARHFPGDPATRCPLLYRVSPTDPVSIAGAALFLVRLPRASLIPALRYECDPFSPPSGVTDPVVVAGVR